MNTFASSTWNINNGHEDEAPRTWKYSIISSKPISSSSCWNLAGKCETGHQRTELEYAVCIVQPCIGTWCACVRYMRRIGYRLRSQCESWVLIVVKLLFIMSFGCNVSPPASQRYNQSIQQSYYGISAIDRCQFCTQIKFRLSSSEQKSFFKSVKNRIFAECNE